MPDGWLVDEESMVIFYETCTDCGIFSRTSSETVVSVVTCIIFSRFQPQIPDPTAEKPDDWEDDTDGEWEPALIDNPVCESAPGCGQWNKPMIDNPL